MSPPSLSSPRFVWCVLPALWAAAYLPSLFSHDLRLEEGRRAVPARDMVHSGNYVVPTLHGQVYLSKPPLYFWLVALAGAFVGGVNEIAVRLPAAIAALAGAWVVFALTPRRLAPATRALAALLAVSSVILLDKGTLGELETVFSALVLAAIVVWFNGASAAPDGPSLRTWLTAGAPAAAAMLTKGPPALLLFYLAVIPHLVRAGRLSALLSAGHGLFVVITWAPLLLWAWAVTGYVDTGHALRWWLVQMRLERPEAAGWLGGLLRFPLQTALMLLPWGAIALPVLSRPMRERLAPYLPEPTRRFLLDWIVATVVVFGVWPFARARYVMVLIYPTCVLAAGAILGTADHGWVRARPGLMSAARRAWSVLPAVIGGVGLVIAAAVGSPGAPWAALALLGWAIVAAVQERAAALGPRAAAWTAAWTAAAVAVLCAWSTFSIAVRPHLARLDRTRVLRTRLAGAIPPEVPVYTMFVHWERETDPLTDHNLAFYLGPGLTPLRLTADPAEPFRPPLPPGRPCAVIMSRADLEHVSRLPGVSTRVLTDLPAGTGELLHVEVVRSTPPRLAPPADETGRP